MTEWRRGALAAGVCFAAHMLWDEGTWPVFLLLGDAVIVASAVAVWRSGRRRQAGVSASGDVEFRYPVYVLRDSAGLSLCTAEPTGGFLAVFTSPDTAVRFVAIRQLTNWAPTPIGRTQLLDLLHSAKTSNRVDYVVIDPLSDDRQDSPVFPLPYCIKRLNK